MDDETTVSESVKLRYGLKRDHGRKAHCKYFYGGSVVSPKDQVAEFLAREAPNIKWYVVRLVTRTETVLERSK
jgi:hypothetical protein